MAAMRLMAEQGVEGVSLRMVNSEAKAKNTSAVTYHFGNKIGLVTAVVEMLTRINNDWRVPRVEALKSSNETYTPVQALTTTYIPYYGFFYQPRLGLHALKFLSRLIADSGPEMRVILNGFTEPLAADTFDLLAPILPDIPEELLKTRILFSLTNLISGASDAASMAYSPFGDMSYDYPIKLAEDHMIYLAAGISAPAPELDPEFEAFCKEQIEIAHSNFELDKYFEQ